MVRFVFQRGYMFAHKFIDCAYTFCSLIDLCYAADHKQLKGLGTTRDLTAIQLLRHCSIDCHHPLIRPSTVLQRSSAEDFAIQENQGCLLVLNHEVFDEPASFYS